MNAGSSGGTNAAEKHRLELRYFLKAQSSKPEKRFHTQKGQAHIKVSWLMGGTQSQLRDSGGFSPHFL
jgi:hypothetical protein